MAIVHGIEVDMVPSGRFAELWLNQYDDDFLIEATLYASRGNFSIQPDTTAAIRGLKPDGNGYSADAEVDVVRGVVTITGDQQITAAAGRSLYELTLYKNGKELNTANFYLIVEPSALDKDAPPSDSKLREFTQVWDRADEIIEAGERHDEAARIMEENAQAAAASEAAAKASEEAAAETLERVNEKAEQIQRVTYDSDQLAQEALDKSLATENLLANSQTEWEAQRLRVEEMGLTLPEKVDGGYVSPEGYLILTANGMPVGEPIGPFAGGGGAGGGGGGGGNMASLSVTNQTAWGNATTVSNGEAVKIVLDWSSVEDGNSTGNGTLRLTVNGGEKASLNIPQGLVEVDLGPYLSTGSNSVSVNLYDVYGNYRRMIFTVTVVALSLRSSFDNTQIFSGPIRFPFTPTGGSLLDKTVHFILDGEELETMNTKVSGVPQTYTVPAQPHGAHTLRVYFEALINGQMVRSNELYYEFTCVAAGGTDPIITSDFAQTTAAQYSTLAIRYRVYNPMSDQTGVKIYARTGAETERLVSDIVVGQEEQIFAYRADDVGPLTIRMRAGLTEKLWQLDITKTKVEARVETESLALDLSPRGRSNNEANRGEWKSGSIAAELRNFGWRLDGWLNDEAGMDVLRLNGDARAVIPYPLFGQDFKSTGKTIEIDFATRDVFDYSAVVLSCTEAGSNIGLRITPQSVSFRGAQSEIGTLYKDGEHVRLSIVIGKQSEYRLILVYINGIMSRAVQYASGERFTQGSPGNIVIGSNDCGVDIYGIRVYDQDLNRKQILHNWIADTGDVDLMVKRWEHNDVYDDDNLIDANKLPEDLPRMYITCRGSLPQYKGDKRKGISGRYVDPKDPSRSFTFNGCEMDVQGTSSAIYYRKNYDMKFKGGFNIGTAPTVGTYALRPGSIPFDRFVLKADVASSESTNNTGLTGFYNDTCTYKTPEMLSDPRVRHGIEGVPIVLYWYDPATDTTEFLGKYNFNLPKRAPAPLGYSGDMESWEWQRNNSANVKFKDDDFTSVDEDNRPLWYDDFEARFPSDEHRDYSKLKELISWVKSTDREQATGDPLASPVTLYSPVTKQSETFTADNAEYRLARFRAECADYVEMESAYFYYLFTELFLMIDSRAKNMFVGFKGSPVTQDGRAMDRKAVFEPYDMDTAIGTNNSGILMFGYSLEDTDTVSSVISGSGGTEANVFNAQDSVFWVNLRDAFGPEIAAVYKGLRSAPAENAAAPWSYEAVEGMYEEHQSHWPEAVFNEDAYIKYLVPLVDPVTTDESTGNLIRTDRYLTMLQGSKAEQRKWWLRNRFWYMDSKFETGSAESNTISMRLFNDGVLTLTSAIDVYQGVRFGQGTKTTLKRSQANTPVPFPYEIPKNTGVQEMETTILNAGLITDVGDLSPLYPNELDFSKAVRLKRLQLGSAAAGYSNTSLHVLNVKNSPLLEYIDVRNCPELTISVDLENSPRLREAYFEGTAITGVDLADGCAIETLHLPGTITTLTLLNLNKLTKSGLQIAGYSHISRLMLANIPNEVLDLRELLTAIQENAPLVNLQGFDLTMESPEEIEAFLDLLDSMGGGVTRDRNENGDWMYHEHETAERTVSGTIRIASLTGDKVALYQKRYPYITYAAAEVTSTITYKSYDGSVTYETRTLHHINGVLADDTSYTYQPERAEDEEGTYTFLGWSTRMGSSTADPDAQEGSYADKVLYAVYRRTPKFYTVFFYDSDGTLLQTVENVVGGGSAYYNGETPSKADHRFIGWRPAPVDIHGNTDCYAVYQYIAIEESISDSWDDIIAAINDGSYKTRYQVGDTKKLDLGSEGLVAMQIAAIDGDELADGSGKAPITWISRELLATAKKMRTAATGNVEGWAESEMRAYLKETIKPLIPANVAAAIAEVSKVSYTRTGDITTTDDLWIPSYLEINYSDTFTKEASGVCYDGLFDTAESRGKHRPGGSNAVYWLRSVCSTYTTNYMYVTSAGGANGNPNNALNVRANSAQGVALGFCLGKTTE